MSYKPLENVTIVFSTANITVCADEWGDLYYTRWISLRTTSERKFRMNL